MNSKKQQRIDIPFFGFLPTRSLSIGLLTIAAAAYTILNIASRFLAEGFPVMTQVYMRVSIGTLMLTILFWKSLRWKRIVTMPKKDFAVMLSMGVIGFTLVVYFITQGVLNTKLVNVTVVFASVPFFSYLYSFLFLKKTIHYKLIGLLCVSLIGIMFLSTKSFTPKLTSFGLGEWFAFLAAATAGWYYVGRKLLSDHLSIKEITVVIMMIASLSAFIFALIRGETFSPSAFTHPIVLLGLFMGSSMNALVNPIEIFAFKHLDAVVGTQILLLDNIFALILGYLIFSETVTSPEIIGGLIVIGSVYFANKLIT